MSYGGKTMVGYAVLGAAVSDMKQLPYILSGRFDEELKCAVFHEIFKRPADCAKDLEHPQVVEDVDRIKDALRAKVQKMVNAAADEIQKAKVQDEFKDHNKPSVYGTVTEIATKYNISKSEVRRLKASGQLSTLIKD